MKVFEILSDVEKYRWIHPVDDAVWDMGMMDFAGDKKSNWKPIKCYVDNLKKEVGSFYEFSGRALTFDKYAYEGMCDILEMAGEILPITMEEGDDLYVLNVLDCVNALDKEKSIWHMRGGKRTRLKKYVFQKERVHESSLFKIPENNYGAVLTYTGLKDSDDEFIGRYQRLGLTGLIFEELWSDEDNNNT
jgi:hypothetical protein